MDIFLLSLLVLVAAGCFPLITFHIFSMAKAIYALLTVAGCITGLYAVLGNFHQPGIIDWSVTWLHLFHLSFRADTLSLFFLLPVLLVSPLAALYSLHYFSDQRKAFRSAVNMFFTNVLIVAMMLLTLACNMVSFALVWEVMSVSSFFLVLYSYEKKATRTAGYLYFLFAQAGALLIFSSFAFIFSHTGTLDFSGAAQLPERIKLIAFFLALIGFGSKAGVFPLHIWLPYAHPAAPSHISAIMSGVMIKMGIYGIFRMYIILAPGSAVAGEVLLVMGMISGILGVLYALGKHDLKRLLAYHSVENIGIILMGAGLGMIGIHFGDIAVAAFGFAGSLLHVLNHSIFKSLLFLGGGAVIKETGRSHVDEMGGLMKTMPLTGRTFLVGSVSIAGLPPFNGFISEFLIYFSAFQAMKYPNGIFLLAILAILSLALIGGLASFCFTKVVGIVFLGEPRHGAAGGATDGGWPMTLPMVVLAGFCLVIGVFPESFIAASMLGSSVFPGMAAGLASVGGQLLRMGETLAMGTRLFLAFCVAVYLLRLLLYRGKEISAAATWGCGFTRGTPRIQYTGASYARSVVHFFQPFVRVEESNIRLQRIFPGKTRFSNKVHDISELGLMLGLVAPVLNTLAKFRWIQHGKLQWYIGYIIVAILVVLLSFFI